MHRSQPPESWGPSWPPPFPPRSEPGERLVWLEAQQDRIARDQAAMGRRLESLEGSLSVVHSRLERLGGVTLDAARSLERMEPLAGRIDRMEAAAADRARSKSAAREWRAEQVKLAQWVAVLVAAVVAALNGAPADVLKVIVGLLG
jgi:septal ring factor EnvC (AmiA/AmiB activator)